MKCIQAQNTDFNQQLAITYIDYSVGNYQLTDDHKAQLDSIFSAMRPNTKIELNGYADNQGNRSYNLELSKNRNKKIIEYFTNKGIAIDHITAEYHGERFISETETSEYVKQKTAEL